MAPTEAPTTEHIEQAGGTNWEQVAAARRDEVRAGIPSEWLIPENLLPPLSTRKVSDFVATSGFFTPQEIEITASSAAEITRKVVGGTWTAEEVTRAFCKSAAVSHQLVNCLTHTQFPEAIQGARNLDAEFAQTRKPRGPFHGVPISLKDNINLEGVPTSIGFVGHLSKTAEKNSYIVDLLVQLGAIVYVKTNVPPAMMSVETFNNVFGVTSNPLNRNLTPGGSSGGESALIASLGSPLGVGTDIGGSLRIPASTTGLFTLRGSANRLPIFDFGTGVPGQEAILSVQGPLARTLEDVALYYKAIIDTQPWLRDPRLLPIPWRVVELPPRLKFAVVWHDGYVRPTPPVERALATTVEKVKAAGHEVVEWDPKPILRVYKLLLQLFTADGGKTFQAQIDAGGEPAPRNAAMFLAAKELGTYDLWQLHREKAAIWKEWLDLWNGIEGLDGLLLPASPYLSARHTEFKHSGYTGLFNLLDYPAAVFPCGVVGDKDVDVRRTDDLPDLSPADRETRDGYDPEEIHGMPVGIQLVGRRYHDEKVLALVERVLEATKA